MLHSRQKRFLPGFLTSSSLPRKSLEMADTLGTVFLSHMPSLMSLSRTSQENTPGFSHLYPSTVFSISGVASLGFVPPITPGRMLPVSWYLKKPSKMLVKIELASLAFFYYLFRIFETQPWLTRNWREITQGRTPAAAISMIFRRMWLGNGRPLMNTPPNWFTLPWPEKSRNLENVTNQPISDIAANPFWTLGWRWEE